MTSLSNGLRRGMISAVLAAVFALLFASPVSAHAELVSSDPASGERLEAAPDTITMTFTESVNLVDDGIHLVDSVGATLKTPAPSVTGHTVTWPMPAHLPDGSYAVSWRVVSSDGHPVAGAFSFGIGAAASNGPATVQATPTSETAPWQVIVARLAGYLAFSLLAGVIAFVLFCSPGSRTDATLQLLVRVGLVGGFVAAVAGLLMQGPYTAGVPATRLFDPGLLRETLGTPFGTAMAWRLTLYAALLGLVWRLPVVASRTVKWLVALGVLGAAAAIAAAGHGAASGRLVDLAVVAVHVVAAGIWVGGLVVLVALGRSVERRAWHQFSTLAMTSVLVLVATGALNSLSHVHAVAQLWQTRYGLVLVTKLVLVAGALATAAVSRRRLQQHRVPLRSVRLEALVTVAVLTATAVLSMTTPPPRDTSPTGSVPGGAAARSAAANAVVQMSLGSDRRAVLGVLPASTAGSQLHLLLTDDEGQPIRTTRVRLKLSNPGRGLGAIPVPLDRRNGVWVADFTFPLPGTWKAILSVEDPTLSAVVTSGTFTVTG